ncbi:MAG: hypothetical protein ACOH5I_26680 [Oligoflexus sp.]
MKKLFIASLALLSACGTRSSSNGPASSPPYNTPTIPIVPPVGERDTIFRYQPDFLRYDWKYSEFADLPKNLVPAADDLYRYWESWRDYWATDLDHGYVPKTYLEMIPSGLKNIRYVDLTEGETPGFDKMPTVIENAFKRCPILNDPKLQAPLEVRWGRSEDVSSEGRFFRQYLRVFEDEGSIKIRSNSQFYPAILIRSSDSEEFRDRTMVHEYGHFLHQAWSLNHGRSMVQSYEFSEFFAELVRHLCWGSVLEKPGVASQTLEQTTRYGRPFDSFYDPYKKEPPPSPLSPYNLKSLEKLIMWEIHNDRFHPDAMLRAALETLSRMRGRKLDSYPVYDGFDGSFLANAPWSADDSKAALNDQAVMFTRSEFLELFCDNYACGELEYLIAADAEGKRKLEW